jgi:hypothetical protein
MIRAAKVLFWAAAALMVFSVWAWLARWHGGHGHWALTVVLCWVSMAGSYVFLRSRGALPGRR